MTQDEPNIDVISGEKCPMCGENTLTLTEMERDIPFFGVVAIFSMSCMSCHYHKADVEAAEHSDPVRFDFTIDSEDDMSVRVVKSSNAIIKFGRIGKIESGEASNGYVTNIEGLLNRLKKQVEFLRDSSDDKADQKKAKNHLKKLQKVMWGQDTLTITLEDKTGNSAIISEKAEKKKLKK
jgi:zinc finger protein